MLESTVHDPPSVNAAGTGPPSPLTPTEPPPQREADSSEDEPYPFPNPDLKKGKHQGIMRPPNMSEEFWKAADKNP